MQINTVPTANSDARSCAKDSSKLITARLDSIVQRTQFSAGAREAGKVFFNSLQMLYESRGVL